MSYYRKSLLRALGGWRRKRWYGWEWDGEEQEEELWQWMLGGGGVGRLVVVEEQSHKQSL